MTRCIIITAYLEGCIKDSIEIQKNDFILCADGGYKIAKQEQIIPHLLIGDFDSFKEELPNQIEIIKHPVEKDDTDTMLCIKYAIEHDYDEIAIIGGMGGRIDHTFSNIQSMCWAMDFWTSKKLNRTIYICDSKNKVFFLEGGSITLEGNLGEKISLISYTDRCTGVYTNGLKWPLIDAVLTNSAPIGISNEFLDSKASISVAEGKLLITISKD